MLSGARRFSARVRESWWKVPRARRLEVYAFWRSRPVDPNQVVYESFAGNGALCNPEAIFRGLRADPDFAELKHVWVLSNSEDNATFVAEFARQRNVRFVEPGTSGYYRALATSGYLVNNATFPVEFSKRAGQTYLNTWHGTPLKRMGYDIGDAAWRVANVIRNFLAADFLLTTSPYMTERLYEEAHLLRNIYRGRVIDEGYPRVDHQFADAGQVHVIRAGLEDAGLRLGGRKVVLYAPTWKGESFGDPHDDAELLLARVTELEDRLDAKRYVVLLKTHQIVHKYAAGRPEFAGRLIPNEIPTNSVLAVTDILVTDYSSIFFDFLATGRPIAFLTPDIDDYAGYRGLYLEPGDWPGPVATTIDELARELNAIITSGVPEDVARRSDAMRHQVAAKEDGGVTARVIDIVFRGRADGYSVEPIRRDERQTILFHVGGMRPGAITDAAIELLDAIDHTRFDVSVVFPYTQRKAVLEQQGRIHPAVRQFARVGSFNGSQVSQLAHRRSDRLTTTAGAAERRRRLWDDEWTRCFGMSTFDTVVDFTGQGRLWSRLMLHAPGARRLIWLHEDMAAARLRALASGNHRRARELSAVFATYRGYDALVSATSELTETSARELAEYAEPSAFISASEVGDFAEWSRSE
jgi:CDP-glycerol glycerophosphotransferase (TagB/SpsB family)